MTEPVDLGIGGITVSREIHIAHFYHGRSQMQHVISPYIEAGLRNGEFVALVIDPSLAPIVLDDLGDEGRRAQSSGQLKVGSGAPTPEGMGEFAEALGRECADGGFARLRVASDMSYAASVGLDPLDMMRFEAMSDGAMPEGDEALVLCQYDLTAFPGSIIMDALKTHPLCVSGGLVQANPLHMDSRAFLEELAVRTAA